jgi:hypothetical protein
MMSTGRTSKLTVLAASAAVVASFAAAPAAQAATRSHSGQSHARVAGHHAPARVNAKGMHMGQQARGPLAAKARIARASVHHTNPNAKRPVRVARLRSSLHRSTWHGRPSFVARPNHRGHVNISGACAKSGNQSGTWAPTSACKSYDITGDVTVLPTKHLTIKAGTIVYVEPTAQGGSLAAGDPSLLPDIIVQGTLNVLGTAKAPVTITSANAQPNTSTPPNAGDWGYLFFDHTGGNKGAGTMTHMRLMYAEGLASDGVAPKLTFSTVADVLGNRSANTTSASSIYTGAGIDYEDVSGAVTFDHDTFDGAEESGVVVESDSNHTNFAGHPVAGHAIKFTLTNSHLTGGAASGLEDTVFVYSNAGENAGATTGSTAIALNVANDDILQTGGGWALEVEAGDGSSTVAGTADVTGSVTSTAVRGGSSSYGVYVLGYTDDASGGTKVCSGAAVCELVKFLRDNFSAYNEALETEAVVSSGAGHALDYSPVGEIITKTVKKVVHRHHKKKVIKKKIKVHVPGGTYRSEDSDAIEGYALQEGSKGHSTLSMPIVNSTVDGYEDSVYTDTSAYYGSATTNVSAIDTNMSSASDYNIEPLTTATTTGASTSGSDPGAARSNVSVNSGRYLSGDDNFYNADDTISSYGPASSNFTISNATVKSDSYNVYQYVYGDDVGGTGPAKGDAAEGGVKISHSKLEAYDGNVYDYVEADFGRATVSGNTSIDRSTLAAYDNDSVFSEVYGAYNAAATGGYGHNNTKVTNSTINGYDDGLDLETYTSYAGSAVSNPVVKNSTIVAADDYGINNDVEASYTAGSGSATGRPVITGATITSYDATVDNYVWAVDGDAAGNGTFTGKATGDGRLVISSSKLTATDDDGIYNDAYGNGTGLTIASPTFNHVTLSAMDDVGFELEAEPGGNGGSALIGAAKGKTGIVQNSTISSYDYAVEADAGPWTNNVSGNSSKFITRFLNDKLTSTESDGVYADYTTNGSSALLAPTFTNTSIDAPDDYALYLYLVGTNGSASQSHTVDPVLKNSPTESYYGDYLYAYDGNSTSAPGKDVASGTFTNSPVDAVGSSSSVYGIDVEADCYKCQNGAGTDLVVHNSPIRSTYEYGIYDEAYAGASSAGNTAVKGSVTSTKHDPVTSTWAESVYTDAETDNGTGNATNSFSVKGVRLVGEYDDVEANTNASGGTATHTGAIANNIVAGEGASSSGTSALYVTTNGKNTVEKGSVTGNQIVDWADNDGIDYYTNTGGGTATYGFDIAHNLITNVSDNGIYVKEQGTPASVVSGSTSVVSHNTVTRSGGVGIWFDNLRATVTDNLVTANGTASSPATGLEIANASKQGSVSCNVIFGDTYGVYYTGNAVGGATYNGDPKTFNNVFKASGARNSVDIYTDNAGTGKTYAKSNYWGGSPRVTAGKVATGTLSSIPKCAKTAGA